MDPIYIPQYDGYIIDNPNIDFVRCDGKVFSYDEVNTANMSDTSNSLTVNGGQRRSPLAYIDTDRNTELTFTSSLFTLEMFEMANAEEIEEKDYATLESRVCEIEDGLKVTLPFEVQRTSVKILSPRGLEPSLIIPHYEGEITEESHYMIRWTVIEFNSSDVTVGQTIRISYKRRVVDGDRVTVKTDSTTAKGSFYAHYPLYSSGSDCTESSQKGTLHIYFPKCRATALPGFDASYKSAQAPGVTFSTIDPKRADKKIFDIMYESKDGEISLADTTIVFASSGMQSVTLESGANYFTLNVPAVVTDPPMWAAFGDLLLSSSIQLNKGDVYEITGIPDNLPISFTRFELYFVGIGAPNKVVDITNPVVRFVSNGETITKISANFMVRERIEEPTSIEVTPTIKKVIDWD